MKFCKRLVTMLLAAALLLGAIPAVSAVEGYTGVADWFEPSLREMQELDLLPDSYYGMDVSEDITRGEMCELAVHALEKIWGYSIEPERTDYFSDTSADYIVKAYELGIVSGYPDGTFKPGDPLTRQEFFQIIENFCNAAAFQPEADESYLTKFDDKTDVANWAREAAQICVKYGYVNGRGTDQGAQLDPTGNTVRCEAMAMFLRAYKSLNEYYYYIKNAQVTVDDNTGSSGGETGENTVVDNVEITGVDMRMLVDTNTLNVRSSWSTDGKILGTVRYGADLTVTGLCANGWVQILYKGQTAYVSGDYVTEYQEVDHDATEGAVEVANYALSFVGYAYVYGGKDPSTGFDCSGLMYYCYGHFGYSLNRVADDQMDNGTAVSYDNLQVGDLVFFGSGSYANHVGIYIGNGNFVHAANPSSGVRVSSLNETYYANRYIGARRIIVN